MTNLAKVIELVGFHGTDAANLDLIEKDSFKKSNKRNEWFGKGAYFFMEGTSSQLPEVSAEQWAIDQSWDNSLRAYTYTNWIVLKCKVEVKDDELLDLRENEGRKVFNYFREMLLKKLLSAKISLKKGNYEDGDVFDLLKQEIEIKVVIGEAFVKFADTRRYGGSIQSRIPNVTMFCVDNTDSDYIVASAINLKKKGVITI